MTNQTGKRLFFLLLHNARRLKNGSGWSYRVRQGYLLGMMRVFVSCREDFEIADNARGNWKSQKGGMAYD